MYMYIMNVTVNSSSDLLHSTGNVIPRMSIVEVVHVIW